MTLELIYYRRCKYSGSGKSFSWYYVRLDFEDHLTNVLVPRGSFIMNMILAYDYIVA